MAGYFRQLTPAAGPAPQLSISMRIKGMQMDNGDARILKPVPDRIIAYASFPSHPPQQNLCGLRHSQTYCDTCTGSPSKRASFSSSSSTYRFRPYSRSSSEAYVFTASA